MKIPIGVILKIITKIFFRCKNVEPYFNHKQDTKKASKNRAKKVQNRQKLHFHVVSRFYHVLRC